MIELEYSAGSPFARAVRILLHELGLEFRGVEVTAAPALRQLGGETPTMQVPTLRDGDAFLWDSAVIAEYLLSRASLPQIASGLWREAHEWEDKLVFSTIQTFGTAVTTVSQLASTGVTIEDNAHLERCAERAAHILEWLERRLPDGAGFLPGVLSAQDIFLACHLRFVEARPLGLAFDMNRLPKVAALLAKLDARASFGANPVLWWDPDMTRHHADGRPAYD